MGNNKIRAIRWGGRKDSAEDSKFLVCSEKEQRRGHYMHGGLTYFLATS